MAYMVVGKFSVEYDKKTDNSHVSGSNLYILESITSSNGEGMRPLKVRSFNRDSGSWTLTDKIYIPSSKIKFDDIVLNKKCEVQFDSFGNVKGILY